MVNPKHAEFYKTILLFEDLGPERYYPRVAAPAVALRLNLDAAKDKYKDIYSTMNRSCNLYSFFFGSSGLPATVQDGWDYSKESRGLDNLSAKYFFIQKTNILDQASPEQMSFMQAMYPGLQ